MSQQYKVSKRGKLLAFLFENLEGWSKKTIKQRLQNASVAVNGTSTTKHDFILTPDDVVTVGIVVRSTHQKVQTLEIIYQDKDLIAINKPAGLLSVGTTSETKRHALALLRVQLTRTKKSSLKLWPVHRLDRETSGILLFATTKEVREAVMSGWDETQKHYSAVVLGTPKKDADTINEPLRLDEKEYKMHIGKHKLAKTAITHYQVLKSTDTRSLLDVQIETGRQHQIRAHLSWMGHAIVGDERYGTKGGRMGLHARKLRFIHPVHKKVLDLEVEAPNDFRDLLA
jgi:23S rRNA pseudouridine1911/1915/1917 synthase